MSEVQPAEYAAVFAAVAAGVSALIAAASMLSQAASARRQARLALLDRRLEVLQSALRLIEAGWNLLSVDRDPLASREPWRKAIDEFGSKAALIRPLFGNSAAGAFGAVLSWSVTLENQLQSGQGVGSWPAFRSVKHSELDALLDRMMEAAAPYTEADRELGVIKWPRRRPVIHQATRQPDHGHEL